MRLTQLIKHEAGIHNVADTMMMAPTRLSLRTVRTRLMLSSSTMSQKRSTMSWTVFSQTPCTKKKRVSCALRRAYGNKVLRCCRTRGRKAFHPAECRAVRWGSKCHWGDSGSSVCKRRPPCRTCTTGSFASRKKANRCRCGTYPSPDTRCRPAAELRSDTRQKCPCTWLPARKWRAVLRDTFDPTASADSLYSKASSCHLKIKKKKFKWLEKKIGSGKNCSSKLTCRLHRHSFWDCRTCRSKGPNLQNRGDRHHILLCLRRANCHKRILPARWSIGRLWPTGRRGWNEASTERSVYCWHRNRWPSTCT